MTRRAPHLADIALPLGLVLVVGASACGGRSELRADACAGASAIPCVTPGDDPCGPLRTIASSCDAASGTYVCPAGAWPHARAPATPAPCLPFSDPAGGVLAVAGSLVGVPTDDGRCLWIADQVTTTDGQTHANVAFAPDRTLPFGTCPTAASFAGGSPDTAVTLEGGDPSWIVQIASASRGALSAGHTVVAYRLFQIAEDAAFGVQLVGGGLGEWDTATQRIIVSGGANVLFPQGFDLGEASLAMAPFTFLWGCPTQDGLAHDCVVTRFDAQGVMQLFTGGSTWVSTPTTQAGATVFQGGPWISSVVPRTASAGLLHVWADGFGSTLSSHLATAPEGPWSSGPTLGACNLPVSDTHAYCAGPVVHRERANPLVPGELVVTYGVGTTAPDGSGSASASLMSEHPADYWSRIQWATAP